MMRAVAGQKPFWMTLQIAFSGVANQGRTLKFPTFAEQRFMAWEAIINGARGLTWFGGGLPETLNERDRPLVFKCTYFDSVMRSLLNPRGRSRSFKVSGRPPPNQVSPRAPLMI